MLARLEFLLLLLDKHKKEYIWVFVIATFLIALLSSVIFVTSSLQKDLFTTLNAQDDIVVQRYVGGRVQNIPESWVDEYLNIDGVRSAVGRVYGNYYYEQKEHHFFIVGIDFYDDASVKLLGDVVKDLDLDKFLAKENMIIGRGIKEFFDPLEYKDFYTFRPPDRSKKRVYIYATFDDATQLLSNDVIIMQKETAKKILGIKEDEVSDITLNIANDDELQTIVNKLIVSHFDTRVITKQDLQNYYKGLFNYKGGIFLTLYIVVLISFLLIIYQRYTTLTKSERKEVAILRSIGWSIEQILWMKLIQNFLIIVIAYLGGVVLGYLYVFVLKAPLLKQIFLGMGNLQNSVAFNPVIDAKSLFLLFVFFVVPYMLSIIIPLWREVSKEINEVLR